MTQKEFAETTIEYRKSKAEEISKTITIRSYDNGSSKDETRSATKPERDILYNLAFGAMNAYGYRSEECGSSLDAVMDTMEMTCHLFLPECNAYDTLYTPIRRIIEGQAEKAAFIPEMGM